MLPHFINTVIELIGQISVGIAILAVYGMAARRYRRVPPPWRNVAVGCVFGLQACIALLIPVHLQAGVTISTASASVALGGLFGGWQGGMVSVLLCGIGRYYLDPVMPSAMLRTVVVGVAGIGLNWLAQRQKREPAGVDLVAVSALTVAASLGSFAFASPERQEVLVSRGAVPLALALALAALLLGGQYLAEQRRRRLTDRLEESESRMRDVLNNLPGTVYQMRMNDDGSLVYTFASDRIADAAGAPASEVLRRPELVDSRFFAEEEGARREYLQRSMATMQPGMREFRMRAPNGTVHWLRTHSTPKRDAAGRVVWTGFTLDITEERKRDEELRRFTEELESSNRQLQGIIASVPGSVYRISHGPGGSVRFHFISDGIRKIAGLEPEALIRDATLLTRMYLPEDEAERIRVYKESAEAMTMRERIFRLRREDGSIRWLHSLSTPHRDASGEVVWDGVTLDITEQKQLEEDLRKSLVARAESEERLKAIISAVPGVVYQIRYEKDGSSRYTFMSEGVRDVWGYAPEEILKDQSIVHNSRVPEEEPHRVRSAMESAATMSLRVREFRGHHRDGTIHWFLSRSMPHLASDGAVVFDGITLDVTDRKKLEEELRRTEHLSALAGLVDGVAHNFNNLLQIISGGAELMREEAAGHPGQRAIADQILAASDRGARLVTDLRRFSRSQPSAGDHSDVNGLLRDLADLAESFVGSATSIKFVGGPGVWQVAATPTRLQTAVLGLLLNARDAMPEGGVIRIETRNAMLGDQEAREASLPAGAYVEIVVSDTGVGMPPEVLHRATEPFFTTAPAKRPGLGLSAVNTFVHQHGGRLSLSSRQGAGTQVRLYLPAVTAAAPAAAQPLG